MGCWISETLNKIILKSSVWLVTNVELPHDTFINLLTYNSNNEFYYLYLLCTKHHIKYNSIHHLTPWNNSIKYNHALFTEGKTCLEKLGNFPPITQLLRGKTKVCGHRISHYNKKESSKENQFARLVTLNLHFLWLSIPQFSEDIDSFPVLLKKDKVSGFWLLESHNVICLSDWEAYYDIIPPSGMGIPIQKFLYC